jgi:hypothetical protein
MQGELIDQQSAEIDERLAELQSLEVSDGAARNSNR